MNNNPPWWDATITVFNKYINPDNKRIEWFSTVIHNCFWKNANNKVIIDKTILETNDIICRIPEDERYLIPADFFDLADKSKNFTLNVEDIIVKGEIKEEIDEYINGMRSSDFIKKHKSLQGCMRVQVVADNTGSIRNNKHYFVSGE